MRGKFGEQESITYNDNISADAMRFSENISEVAWHRRHLNFCSAKTQQLIDVNF